MRADEAVFHLTARKNAKTRNRCRWDEGENPGGCLDGKCADETVWPIGGSLAVPVDTDETVDQSFIVVKVDRRRLAP